MTGILRPGDPGPGDRLGHPGGLPRRREVPDFDGHPSEVYLRTAGSQVTTVDNLLAAQANPEYPSEVNVSQPSDALTAQAEAAGAFDTLFLGLGAVALLVGAVGVANIMVISVLERRTEIGLRRALGATRGQIRAQFLADAILLALAGGIAGVIIGAATTAVYARAKGWAIVIPPEAWAGGLGAALLIGDARRTAARHPRRTPVPDRSPLGHLTILRPPAGHGPRRVSDIRHDRVCVVRVVCSP